MRTSGARVGLRVLSAAALLFAASARMAESSGIRAGIGYGTTGTIESGGVVGTPLIRFQGVGDGTMTTGGTPFDLGRFVLATPPDGTSTTYHDTPFEVSFLARSLDGIPAGATQPVVIQGWLNGTIGGAGPSGVVLSFDGRPGLPGDDGMPHVYPSITAPFALGDLTNYLDRAAGDLGILSPAGSPSLQGVIYSTEVVPEPGTFIFFLAGAAGLPILLNRRRARGVR